MNRMFLLVVNVAHALVRTLLILHKKVLALTDIPNFTIHDLRRTASTLLNERGFNRDAIEKCLNHTATGVRGVYNKAEYANDRIIMMQKWSDYIFSLIYEPNLIFFNDAQQRKSG